METLSDASGNTATFDRAATVRAYAVLARGRTDECDCFYCAKYRQLRGRNIFPAQMLDVCDRLGIDVLKEGEITVVEGSESGMLCYTGELHFVGEVRVNLRTPDGVIAYEIQLHWVLSES